MISRSHWLKREPAVFKRERLSDEDNDKVNEIFDEEELDDYDIPAKTATLIDSIPLIAQQAHCTQSYEKVNLIRAKINIIKHA